MNTGHKLRWVYPEVSPTELNEAYFQESVNFRKLSGKLQPLRKVKPTKRSKVTIKGGAVEFIMVQTVGISGAIIHSILKWH